MRITAIILSGGKSSRMGTDKALLKINDNDLLDRAIEVCQPVCAHIIISSNHPKHRKLGVHIVPDEIQNCGPLGGVFSCLKKSSTDWSFVLSVDAVFVETTFIEFLTNEVGAFDAVVPVHSNGIEPLIALYHKNCLPEMEEMLKRGDFKMRNLFSKINVKYVDVQNWLEKYPRLFFNMNKPGDFDWINS